MAGYVYADVLFAVNLAMNALVLWGAARIMGVEVKWWRLVAAAALGALYAVAGLYLESTPMESVPARVVVGLIMTRLAHTPRAIGEWIRYSAYVLSMSFMTAGAALAVWASTAGAGAWVYPVRWWVLALAPLIAVTGVRLVTNGVLRRAMLKGAVFQIEIHLAGRMVALAAFLDTGNRLEDPLTGSPVVVAEVEAVSSLFPEDVAKALRLGDIAEATDAVQAVSDGVFQRRLRVLPFSSLGEAGGIMLGFRPDAVVIATGRNKRIHKGVVVALCRGPLSHDRQYRALLHPALMEWEEDSRTDGLSVGRPDGVI